MTGGRQGQPIMPADQLDLDAIHAWVQPCGSCDGGLPMSCTHPEGDYRIPMAALLNRVIELSGMETRTEWGVRQLRQPQPGAPATNEEWARFGAELGGGTVMRRQVGPWEVAK